MKKLQITNTLNAYEFRELIPYKTYVYALMKKNTVYILDTYCGSAYMDIIKADYPDSRFIVINTHYHFDHIWGNYSFSNCPIYAHQTCREMIRKHGEQDMRMQVQYFQGVQKLVLPNHCFDGDLIALSDDLLLLYTPGHSIDGISLYDQKQNALFVGDNLEQPLIQIDGELLNEYKKTLEFYLTLPINHIYAGHTLHLTKADILESLGYITALLAGDTLLFEDVGKQKIHDMNRKQMKL